MTNPERQLSQCSHIPLSTNCKRCGIYLHSFNSAVKSTLYDSVTHSSASKYLKHLRRRKCQVLEERQISEITALLLQAICDKFEYSLETLALGMYVFVKSCQKQQKDQKFWCATSLLVASKGIELDKKVPYLNRYQRYADKNFSQEDYELAEKSIFEEMNFNLQYSTFVTFLHFYLTNGVIFQGDNCSYTTLKCFEDQIIKRAKTIVRKGGFVKEDPEKLALSLIKQYRIKYKLDAWPKNMETISGYKEQDLKTIERNDILQPLCSIDSKVKQRANMIENIESKMKFGRKRLQNTMKQSVKENTMKLLQPTLNISSRNNQTFSMSKYTYTSVSRSTDRIMPVHSFASRRV